MRAPGQSVAGFDASILAPQPAADVTVAWVATGTGNPTVPLGEDLVVTWTPGPASELLSVAITQDTGDESCKGATNGNVSLADPLAVFCNVPSSLGTVTIPKALLGLALHHRHGQLGCRERRQVYPPPAMSAQQRNPVE